MASNPATWTMIVVAAGTWGSWGPKAFKGRPRLPSASTKR